jgi:glycerol transport system permease protein
VELFEQPAHTFVGHFIGSPGMNLLPCEIDDAGVARIDGLAVETASRSAAAARGRRTEIGVRPEFVRLAEHGLPATVERVCDIGRQCIVDARCGAHLVKLLVAEGAGVPRGTVRLAFDVPRTPHLRRRLGGRMSARVPNPKAWWLVLPVVLLVAFNAVIPLMAVVNYSVQETFGNNQFFFEGVRWFEQVMQSPRFREALQRQLLFTGLVLAIQIPLGVAIALAMPRKGIGVSVCLVLMAMPLLIPYNVVGAMWNIFALPDIGLMGRVLNEVGFNFNYTRQPLAAWVTLVAMDVWHWTSLVVLLAYAGLSAIPDAYYQAARVDGAGRWAIFRHIQLPKLKHVLLIAVLLRFMDSFMIYTEAVVLTGGGPGNATTLLSIDLVKIALGQFDLGPAAAMSLIYFLIILLLSWLFYTVMTKDETR